MWVSDIQSPSYTPGTRVEVDCGVGVLVCRLHAVQQSTMHLAVPDDARRTLQTRVGLPVRLTLYQAGACLECDTTMRGWIWTRPPLMLVGPLGDWRAKRRRAARRAPKQLAARIVLDDSREYLGWTQDVSATGVSLMIAGLGDVPEGISGRLTLQVENGLWCDDLPVRIARVRHWLRAAGRTVEVGAELQIASDVHRRQWHQCLAFLGVEE